jgi:hypothetical protein
MVGLSLDGIWRSLSMVKDLNNDGIDDVGIGDPLQSKVYVYFGSTETGYRNLTKGFIIEGSSTSDSFGYAIESAGDFNGDGRWDIIIGMPYYGSNNGGCLIYYGKPPRLYMNQKITEMTAADGMIIVGSSKSGISNFGIAVAGLGDFNGDGYDDVAISALYRTAGIVYIIYGGRSNTVGLSLFVDSMSWEQGFNMLFAVNSYAGISLSSAGDVNGDGLDDVLIGGVPYSSSGTLQSSSQQSYIIYGRQGQSSNLNFASGTLSTKDGMIISGGGIVVSGVGDINSDGLPDVVISDYQSSLSDCNSFLFVYPKQHTAKPIFQPTSYPSVTPSSKPSKSFSPIQMGNKPSFLPSRSPSFSFNASTYSPTVSPNYQILPSPSAMNVPTLASPSLIPTRITSMPSISLSPDFKSATPSLSLYPTSSSGVTTPSMVPTETFSPTTLTVLRLTPSPSAKPSACINSYGRSCPPVNAIEYYKYTTAPSASSSLIIVVSLDPSVAKDRIIGTPRRENFIVNISRNMNMSILGNGGGDIYTILPRKGAVINITDFNSSSDKIDLTAFPSYENIEDLLIRNQNNLQKELIFLPERESDGYLQSDLGDTNTELF